jgi:hypothetical protein
MTQTKSGALSFFFRYCAESVAQPTTHEHNDDEYSRCGRDAEQRHNDGHRARSTRLSSQLFAQEASRPLLFASRHSLLVRVSNSMRHATSRVLQNFAQGFSRQKHSTLHARSCKIAYKIEKLAKRLLYYIILYYIYQK